MRDGKERERKRGGRREIWRGNSCFIIIRLCNSDERRDRSSSAVGVARFDGSNWVEIDGGLGGIANDLAFSDARELFAAGVRTGHVEQVLGGMRAFGPGPGTIALAMDF